MTYEFVPQFTRMLNNLSAILDKAQAYADQKKFDVTNLLNSRLAPDQFHFIWQVQATCDTAKKYYANLSGKEAPKHEDIEKTVSDLKERIRSTIQFLETAKPEDFKGWETKKVTNPRREGKYLPAAEFAMHQAIPNFYFHMTTAYAILRNNGVDVGKLDYLGQLNYRPL